MRRTTKIRFISIALSIYGTLAYAEALPEFVLQCSDKGGPMIYRLASDGNIIYFAKIDSQFDINATKKSVNTSVDSRAISMVLQEGDVDPATFRIARDENDAYEVQGLLARDTLALRVGSINYACQKISDNSIFHKLKSAYESSVQKTQQRQKAFDNRPNQI